MSSFAPTLHFCIRFAIQTVRFHAVHTVRRYGARRFFLRIRSILTVGTPIRRIPTALYGAVPCGFRFLIIIWFGAVRNFVLRCGAMQIGILENPTVWCGFVKRNFLRCREFFGEVRKNRTEPHRTLRKNAP